MDVFEVDKFFLFVAFVIPGFISIKFYELICPGQQKESDKLLIDAVAYSCINYALLGAFIYLVETSGVRFVHPTLYVLFYVFVVLIAPVILAWLWFKIRSFDVFQKNLPHPTKSPWDYVFSQRKWYWVIVTLNDGTKIFGKYAKNSFTSSYPEEPQIYLEECWVTNDSGGFERKRENSAGIILIAKDIQSIELFDYT